MRDKHPIYPHRIRQVPRQFSWVDGRLVREHYIDHCSHAAAALYLFLVTVADAQGLSYYGNSTIGKRLSMDKSTLATARLQLVKQGLIAYRKPLYQVLDLALSPELGQPEQGHPSGDVVSIGQVFKKIMEAK